MCSLFRAGPNPRLEQRRLAPSRCRTPAAVDRHRSLGFHIEQPRDVTLAAELTRQLAHLRELAPRKKMLTLLTPTKDIAISEAAVLAKLVLS